MKALLQRVRQAEVVVGGRCVSSIGYGLLVYLGVEIDDEAADADSLARRAAALRIFDDEAGKMNLSLAQVGGEALVVSQFTLAADTRRGRRPSYSRAALPEIAEPLYERFGQQLEGEGLRVARGVFGATMQIGSTNDGPVTLMIDSRKTGAAG